ncbi:MAG TPA: hypothetical protein VFT91_03680 [Dehalococcoidia bacterium]|nr:hypothetical protein [Dehalococcoidia bacterium]
MVLGALLLMALAAAVACGGGGGGKTPEGSPVAGLTDLCQSIAKAKSYRYTFSYKLESLKPTGSVDETALGTPPFALPPAAADFKVAQDLDGAARNPDRVDVTINTEGIGSLREVFVGPDQYVLTGDRWVKRVAEAVPFPALSDCGALLTGVDLTGQKPVEDSVDGAKALRYEVKGVALNTAVSLWTQQSDMGRLLKTYDVTVWVTKDGKTPLRVESSTVGTYPSGRQLTMTLTLSFKDINDSGVKVEPPI